MEGVGTIFSIFRRAEKAGSSLNASVLQPGYKQVAAGYVVYGPSTVFVYTSGRGVFGFTLDPNIGAFVLSHDNMKMPRSGQYYSVNEANAEAFPAEYRAYLAGLRGGDLGHEYSSRYIGSLVADFHRTLLKGGVFTLSADQEHTRRGSFGCYMKPTRSPLSPSRPEESPPTARAGSWKSSRKESTSARLWRSGAAWRWKPLSACSKPPR